MAVFVGKDTKLIVQGITGRQATFHTKIALDYGTNVVAGVAPGKAGEKVLGKIPVFNTVSEAKEATGANASVIYVPARFAADAICEAIDAELDFVCCITENIPVHDMVKVRAYLKGKKTRLLGPNCPGILTTDECRLGLLPTYIHKNRLRTGVARRFSRQEGALERLCCAGSRSCFLSQRSTDTGILSLGRGGAVRSGTSLASWLDFSRKHLSKTALEKCSTKCALRFAVVRKMRSSSRSRMC